jgi:hypothetical protein
LAITKFYYYYYFPNLLHASCFGMLCFTLWWTLFGLLRFSSFFQMFSQMLIFMGSHHDMPFMLSSIVSK